MRNLIPGLGPLGLRHLPGTNPTRHEAGAIRLLGLPMLALQQVCVLVAQQQGNANGPATVIRLVGCIL
jgi:hypothetical protein